MAYENFPARLSCPGARAINRPREPPDDLYFYFILYRSDVSTEKKVQAQVMNVHAFYFALLFIIIARRSIAWRNTCDLLK